MRREEEIGGNSCLYEGIIFSGNLARPLFGIRATLADLNSRRITKFGRLLPQVMNLISGGVAREKEI